jgi:inactivated superfamily I helicase
MVMMNTLKDIEQHISHISQLCLEDLAAFRIWFAEFDAQVWDRQFEEDAATGRLNHLANKALQDLQAGRCTGL